MDQESDLQGWNKALSVGMLLIGCMMLSMGSSKGLVLSCIVLKGKLLEVHQPKPTLEGCFQLKRTIGLVPAHTINFC